MSILNDLKNAESETDEDHYHVALPDFYGPMDLLLTLIEREELEITTIALAQVTNQYLAYVKTLQEVTPDNLTDFLVVASKLIFIKSEVLLPKPPPSIIEEEVDETDDLVQQLKDYKRFKQLAQDLKAIEKDQKRSFVRLAPPLKIEPKLKPGDANITDLLAAARRAFTIKPDQPGVDIVVSRQTVTIGDQIALIRNHLENNDQLRFEALLKETHSRLEVIVTLLAVLELIKRRLIDVKQDSSFGEITLIKLAETDQSEAEWLTMERMTELS